jgi:hypothetical protein
VLRQEVRIQKFNSYGTGGVRVYQSNSDYNGGVTQYYGRTGTEVNVANNGGYNFGDIQIGCITQGSGGGGFLLPCFATSLVTASLCFAAYVLTNTNVSSGIVMNNSSIANISASNGSFISIGSSPSPLFLLPIAALAMGYGMSQFIKSTHPENNQNTAENKSSAQANVPNNKGFGLASVIAACGLGYFAGSGYAKSSNIFPLAVGAIACGLIGAGLNGMVTGKYNFFIFNSATCSIDASDASHVVNIYWFCNNMTSKITSMCQKIAELHFLCSGIHTNNNYTQV